MEVIEYLVVVWQALKRNQQELEEVATVTKGMLMLQRMLKMGQNKRLQTKLQKMHS